MTATATRRLPGWSWYKYTAPGSPWSASEHPGFHVRFSSTSGIADAKITFKALRHGIMINGTIGWKYFAKGVCSGCTGGDHRTGSFALDFVSPGPTDVGWKNNGGFYQVTDGEDEYIPPCTDTAHAGEAGPWVASDVAGKGHADLKWAYTHWVGIDIGVDGTEIYKSVCGSRKSSTKGGADWVPYCVTKGAPYHPDGLAGRFDGEDFTGTHQNRLLRWTRRCEI